MGRKKFFLLAFFGQMLLHGPVEKKHFNIVFSRAKQRSFHCSAFMKNFESFLIVSVVSVQDVAATPKDHCPERSPT